MVTVSGILTCYRYNVQEFTLYKNQITHVSSF